jgi:hypothetical protein
MSAVGELRLDPDAMTARIDTFALQPADHVSDVSHANIVPLVQNVMRL